MVSEESSDNESGGPELGTEESGGPSLEDEPAGTTDRGEEFGGSGGEARQQSPKDDGNLRKFLRKQFALQMENVIPEDLQSILDKIEARLEALRDSEEVDFADQVYGRIRLAAKMLRASAEGSFQLPWKSAASVAAGLAYLLNPMDFLPGIVKGDEAVLDDALVIYLCYTVVEQDLTRFLRSHNLDPEEFGMDSVRTGF
jgi:uncharacterized membrane protein YkvA (DUF1232 family)